MLDDELRYTVPISKTVDSRYKMFCLTIRLGIGGWCNSVLNVPPFCNSCDVNCVPLYETMHLDTPISVKISLRLHSLNGDSVVFWQWWTDWNNQQLEDNVCFLMRTDLDQVVPNLAWGVSTYCRVSFCWVLANFAQMLHLWYVTLMSSLIPD